MHFQALHLLALLFAAFASRAISGDDPRYAACAPKNCGFGGDIKYPFWLLNEHPSYCGQPSFGVTCENMYPRLNFSDGGHYAKEIFYANNSLLVVNSEVYEKGSCSVPLRNVSFDGKPFSQSPKNFDFMFMYNCSWEPKFVYSVACVIGNATVSSFAFFPVTVGSNLKYFEGVCDSVATTPLAVSLNTSSPNVTGNFAYFQSGMNYSEILKMGSLLEWSEYNCSKCEVSGGRCGLQGNEVVCLCKDGLFSQACNNGKTGKTSNRWKKIVIGIASGTSVVVMAAALFIVYFVHKRMNDVHSPTVSGSHSVALSSRTASEMVSNFHGLPIFSSDELRRATKDFDSSGELGDGGFGTVFKGKLQDGRIVAVKRLYGHNRIVEQFTNEVQILARLRHPNLVSLYGCTSPQSQPLMLVYEYASNGTVADHLHGQGAKPGLPVWSTRLKIAIETADALLYLHKSDVVHRDVKTDNILLDENFGVKVADFGLSRPFPAGASHVSTTPHGTPGYLDPEYNQRYQLTEKSDVYSFGVVLMELISSMPAVDITRRNDEINLSAMAMNKIMSNALHELVDPNIGFDSDYKIRKAIIAMAELGFRCLQHEHHMRPCMEEVLKILIDIQAAESGVP